MHVRFYDQSAGDGAALAAVGGTVKKLGENIERWLKKSYTSAEYCFVFENEGTLAGGAAFAVFESSELEVMDFALEGHGWEEGAELLRRGIELAIKPDHSTISYNLYNDNEQYNDIKQIFLDAGFHIAQEKKSFAYESGVPMSDSEPSLSFKCRTESGEELFVEAVERVTVGTLDNGMAESAKKLGDRQAAFEYVEGLKQIDDRPEWWKLAYDGTELIGLVISQKLGENLGAINYIGVLPEKRGMGYVNALLAEGTRVLAESGIEKIIADIDVGNKPLEAALLRLGYRFTYDESVLEMNIGG